MRKSKQKIKATIYDRKNKILSVGVNSYTKTHPLQAHHATLCGKQHKIFLHAEIAALVKCKNKKPYRIVIERYNKNGKPMMAKPCEVCQSAIEKAGIKVVDYTKDGEPW